MGHSNIRTIRWIRLSAWITFQALIVTGLSSAFAEPKASIGYKLVPDTEALRAPQRQEGGLEEIQTSLSAGQEEMPTRSEGAFDVVDGPTTLVKNLPSDTTPERPYRGDVASSVLGLADKILPRRVDTQIAFVAVYNDAGIADSFVFDIADPIASVRDFAEAKGIALDQLMVAMDVSSSAVNTEWLPDALVEIGIPRDNIIAFPQIQQAINVALNNNPRRKLHERSPWFTKSFDILIGSVGATEVSGWINAIAPLPGVHARLFFAPSAARKGPRQARDMDSLYSMRLTNQRNVAGERRTTFELADLVDMGDPHKMYASTLVTGYMNIPGIEYDTMGVTTYTKVFQQGCDPVILVDRFNYAISRQDARAQAIAVTEGFEGRYPDVYEWLLHHGGSIPPRPVQHDVVKAASAAAIPTQWDKSGWPEEFLGLSLVSSRGYDLQGNPVKTPFPIRGDGHRDTQAAAIASGWLRGIAIGGQVDAEQAKQAADRLARDAMGERIALNPAPHPVTVGAFEGARDGSASWKYGMVLDAGQEERSELQQRVAEVPKGSLFLPLELGGTTLRAALADAGTNEVLTSLEREWKFLPGSKPSGSENIAPVNEQIRALVEELTRLAGIDIQDVSRLPISATGEFNEGTTGGTFERRAGYVRLQFYLPYTRLNMLAHIAGTLGVAEDRFSLYSDVKTALVAEERFGGHGLGPGRAGYLTVSTGVDLALMSTDGEPIPIELEQYPVSGGKNVGHFASGAHLAGLAREEIGRTGDSVIMELVGDDPSQIDTQVLGQAFRAGSALAIRLYQQAAQVIGEAIVQAVQKEEDHLAREGGLRIVAGGGVIEGVNSFMPLSGSERRTMVTMLQDAVDGARYSAGMEREIEIALSRLKPNHRGLLGAVALASAGLEETPAASLAHKITQNLSGDIASLLPALQIQSMDFMESGIPGWERLVYTLADGSHWRGGIVHEDVPRDQIHKTAAVSPGSMVRGAATRLKAGATVLNTAVTDSVIREHATLLNSVAEQALVHPRVVLVGGVLEPAFDEESWSYSNSTRGMLDLWVKNHQVKYEGHSYQVELGRRLVAGESVFQSASVGPDSAVASSAVLSSRWGEQTALARIKSLLVAAAAGHADVAGVEHQPDGTETSAVHEVAETAYRGRPPGQYPGTQIKERRTGYTEVVVNNRVTLASTPDEGKTLALTSVFVPPITLFGDYAIFSIFAGAPAPDGIVTDGRQTPRLIRRLTGRPDEQSSQHGRIVADPLSTVAAFSNVIGRLLVLPHLDDPEALASEPEITHLGALSGVGAGAGTGLHGLEAWGQIFPGEAKERLTRAAGIAPWAFLYAPEAIFYLLGQIVQGLPEKHKDRHDTLAQDLLKSGLALSQHALWQEQAKEGQSDQRVVERLVRYVACYTALIQSKAWTGNWVLEDGLYHPDHWSRVDGQWQSDRLPYDQLHAIVHPAPAEVPYRQFSVQELMVLPEGVERPDWAERLKLYLEIKDLKPEQPMTPLANLGSVPSESLYQERRIIGQDDRYYYTVQGGRIGREIPLEQIDSSAVIGTGTVLTGKDTPVGVNGRLFFVVGEGLQAGSGVRLNAVKADAGVAIEDNVKLSWAKLGAGVQIGAGSKGVYIGVAEGSVVAANTVFEPFGVAADSVTSPGNTIGISLMHSRASPGFMGRHSSTTIHHLEHQPVRFTVNGRLHDLGAASLNAAGGVFVLGREDAKVVMSAAYPLSLATVRPRAGAPASEVGAFSILKNLVILEGEIFCFTFHAFSNLALDHPLFGAPGRHNDRIGGALDYPGIFLRNFIPRTKGGIWSDLAASGNYPDERLILRHPRMVHADYAVEALIVGTLRAVQGQFSAVDAEAATHLKPPLQELLGFMDEDLDQIRMPNQVALDPRTSEERDEIQRLIQEVMDRLEDLPGAHPEQISPSGHTPQQLLDGIRRLALNLDGRWRMRNHTFTEVRWEYVDFQDGKARDTWVPVPLGPVVRALFVNVPALEQIASQLAPKATPPAQERAQAILAQVETKFADSAETEWEAWQTVSADLHGFLGDDVRRAWAAEVFGHLNEMAPTAPAQVSIQKALGMLGAAGLEETPAAFEQVAPDLAALRQEKALLPSMKATAPGVGVLAAGLEDARGSALGALLSQVITPDGEPMPVVILARSRAEKASLEDLGSVATILLIPEYSSAEAALLAGEQILKTLYGVQRIIDLGARSPITSTLDRLLSRLGIRLSQGLLPRLQEWLDRAIEALEFA